MAELIPIERIESKILYIRKQKVILDIDLAELYEVEVKNLTRAVKRNMERFPIEFMFQLNLEEFTTLRRQFGTAKLTMRRVAPLAFTEQGVAMLSSVLKSERAIQVNIAIMKTFIQVRKMLVDHSELAEKIEKLESKYDSQFGVIFKALRKLTLPSPQKKGKIGFTHPKEPYA